MNLENVEGFELNVPRLFFQHIHHQLQVVWVGNISSHHLEESLTIVKFCRQKGDSKTTYREIMSIEE